MRIAFSLILVLIFILPVRMSAQEPIDAKKVPAKVIKVFDRKNAKSTEVSWSVDNEDYIVDFTNARKVKKQIKYAESGKILETKTYYEQKKLPSKVRDYVKKEYSHLKFNESYYYEDSKREKHYVVMLSDKVRGFDDPFFWEVWLSSAGKHITTFEPDIPDLEVGTDLPPDTRFEKKVDGNVDDLSSAAADELIDKKDLPSTTLNYLKANYDYEWIYKEILIRDDDDLGTIYYVLMKRQGYSETWENIFDFNGKLLSKERIDKE